MSMRNLKRPVLFPLNEVAAILDEQPQRLREMVHERRLKPALPGGKGKGRQHRFSAAQVYGLANVVLMRRAGLCYSRRHADDIMANWCAMSDKDLAEYLADPDPRLEEEFAVWFQRRVPISARSLKCRELGELLKVQGRLLPIESAIRVKLAGQPADRLAGSQGKAQKEAAKP
jgi:hypothetical protein